LEPKEEKKKEEAKNKNIPTLYSKEFKLGLYKLQPAAFFLPSFLPSLAPSRLASF